MYCGSKFEVGAGKTAYLSGTRLNTSTDEGNVIESKYEAAMKLVIVVVTGSIASFWRGKKL